MRGRGRFSQHARRVAFMVGVCVAVTAGMIVGTRNAFADPHAVFLTDRGQAQIFYNVLAALNQADYVELPNRPDPFTTPSPPPPSPAPTDPARIASDIRFGNYLATGRYQVDPTTAQRTVTFDANGNPVVRPPAETQERDPLPRVRVRQVTSDDGDVFYRERLERRALAEEMRVLIAQLSCRGAETIFGPTEARVQEFCPVRQELPVPPT